MKHLGNFYKDAGFNAPSWDGWTLGDARATARMFVAVKADVAEGKETWDTMVQYLTAVGAEKPFQMWAGRIGEEVPATPPSGDPAPAPAASAEAPAASVQTTVQNQPESTTAPEAPVTQPVASTDTTASPEPTTAEPEAPAAAPVGAEAATEAPPTQPEAPVGDRQNTEAEALQTIQDSLGGTVVEDEKTPCMVCGGQINDIDIARLSKARFGKWACVDDYVKLTK